MRRSKSIAVLAATVATICSPSCDDQPDNEIRFPFAQVYQPATSQRVRVVEPPLGEIAECTTNIGGYDRYINHLGPVEGMEVPVSHGFIIRCADGYQIELILDTDLRLVGPGEFWPALRIGRAGNCKYPDRRESLEVEAATGGPAVFPTLVTDDFYRRVRISLVYEGETQGDLPGCLIEFDATYELTAESYRSEEGRNYLVPVPSSDVSSD